MLILCFGYVLVCISLGWFVVLICVIDFDFVWVWFCGFGFCDVEFWFGLDFGVVFGHFALLAYSGRFCLVCVGFRFVVFDLSVFV